MISKSYYVTEKAGTFANVRRLDNLTGAWLDKSISATKGITLFDVEADPINPDKVFVVGELSTGEGKYGIYVSSDGGDNWTVPTGNYNVGLSDVDFWVEVCVIDFTNIVVCGAKGKVARSTDGGVTFNLCTPLPQQPANPVSNPTTLSNLPVLTIHFISPLVGVVGTKSYVFATNDGGTTWMLLNGGNLATSYLYIPATNMVSEQCYGIHLSADAMTINVVTKNAIFYSTDGGSTFVPSYLFPAESGLHLTWINDNELWAFGKGGQRLKSTNAGASWFVLSAYNNTLADHYAGHLYSSSDGFYSESLGFSNQILATTTSCTSGTTSDNAISKIFAVWTTIQPEGCTACPEGFTELEDGTCQKITTTTATVSPTIYTVCKALGSNNYGQNGTYIYSDITALPKPLTIDGFLNVVDGLAINVPITQTIPVSNPIWGNNLVTGRLNSVGVWNCSASNLPYDTWIGFSACIEIQETKQYFIGIAADNRCRFKIDGTLIFQNTFTAGVNFHKWYVFPIVLTAGTHVIYLEGFNDSTSPSPNPAAFGCEIYDFPASVNPATLTAPADLSPYIVFTSQNKVGQTFDIGDLSGYSCPPDYLLSLCDGAPVCIKVEVADPVICFWQLTPCCEQFDPVIVDSFYFSEGDIGKTVCIDQINGREGCYTVSQTFNPVNYTEPFTVQSFHDTCAECITNGCRDCTTCYQLEDCSDSTNVITVTNNFADYLGQVVILKHCPDKCWIVQESPKISNCCWDVRMNPSLDSYTVTLVIDSVLYTSPSKSTGDAVLTYLNSLGLGTFTLIYPGPNGSAWARFCVSGPNTYGAMSVDPGNDTYLQYEPTCTYSYCYNGQATTVVIESFTTCEACLPPPVQPEPVKLFQRQVAPGYTSKVCSTDYVEKVNCKFAEQVYNVMKNLRYGIETCCEDELQKWSIKKDWLTLEEMKDPNPAKPTCYCYTITQGTGTNDFKYIDCIGNCQVVTLLANQSVNVCAMYQPKVVCPANNQNFEIIKSDAVCTTSQDCSETSSYVCVNISNPINAKLNAELSAFSIETGGTYTIMLVPGTDVTICTDPSSITVISGNPVITISTNTCTINTSCEPVVINCYCYTINPTALSASVNYTNCDGDEVGLIIDSTTYICAQEGTVDGVNIDVTMAFQSCTGDGDCQP